MAKVNVIDKLEKQYTGKVVIDHVNNSITYVHKGSIDHSFINIDNLENYNDINNFHCVFGANTSKSFQYSIVVKTTDYIGIYEKDCKEKGKEKGKGKVLSTVKIQLDAVSRLYTLASYGWKITHVKNNEFILTTPYYKKLTSFRRVMDGNENYFDIKSISVNRFDGKQFLEYINLNEKDIIKECQYKDRDFIYHWISNRIDKAWN